MVATCWLCAGAGWSPFSSRCFSSYYSGNSLPSPSCDRFLHVGHRSCLENLFVTFFTASTKSIECFLEGVLSRTCETCGVAVMQIVQRRCLCGVQQCNLRTWSLGDYKWAKVINVCQDTWQASSPYYKRTSLGSASKFESKPQEFSFALVCLPPPLIFLFAEK